MGLAGFKTAWQRQTKDFGHGQNTNRDQSTKYSCLIFDNRGVGESDKPLMRYSTSEMAMDTLELIDHVGWTSQRQLHVIGVSLGGMIAQELVSNDIRPCSKLSLLSLKVGLHSTGKDSITNSDIDCTQTVQHNCQTSFLHSSTIFC